MTITPRGRPQPRTHNSLAPSVMAAGASAAGASISAPRRLQADLKRLMAEPVAGVSAFPDDDIMSWVATLAGPVGTVFEGQSYKLSLRFPAEYPFCAPSVRFANGAMYHPNVHQPSGSICLDILKAESWSVALDVRSVLLSIQSLLGEPNNNSPLNPPAAQLWANPAAYRVEVERAAGAAKAGSAAAKKA